VNEFVDQCRREWQRLGVPKAVADEMADELAADLGEAEAEGVTAEDLLGGDPRSFAARWASERGVIQGRRWTSRLPAALATLALVPAIVGAVLLIVASPSGGQRLALPLPPTTIAVSVPGQTPQALRVRLETTEAMAAANEAGRARIWVARETMVSDDGDHTTGSVLLIVGLALLAPLTLFWLWRALKRA
jgi:hypothetical protein